MTARYPKYKYLVYLDRMSIFLGSHWMRDDLPLLGSIDMDAGSSIPMHTRVLLERDHSTAF
jgi:hypothetical protein